MRVEEPTLIQNSKHFLHPEIYSQATAGAQKARDFFANLLIHIHGSVPLSQVLKGV